MPAETDQTPCLSVNVILQRHHLRWPSVARLVDGLTGPLCSGGIFLDPTPGARDPAWLSMSMAGERLVLRPEAGALPAHGLLDDPPAPGDVFVDFRAAAPTPDLVGRARHGVWQMSCHAPGAVAGDVMAGEAATAVVLLAFTGQSPNGAPIDTATVQTKSLLSVSHAFASEKAVQLVLHNLRKLALTGALPPPIAPPEPAPKPSVARLPGYGLRVLRKTIERRRDRKGQRKPFALRIGDGRLPDIDPARGIDIPNPPETFSADPFLIERAGSVYCFYEEYPYGTRRGRIAVARLDGTGAERLGPALETPYHLSFPYLVETDDALFMMPETLGAGRIEIWRCTEFPLGWTRHATGPEGLCLADPVLFRRNGVWWLFGNSCHDSLGDFSSELSLFRVDGPDLTTLVPHPLNPVVVGSDRARNGGRVFERDGRLYRLSQDNSGPVYGYGLNIMEINEFSETAYAERRIAQFTPDDLPGTIGCHHADSAGGRWVIDLRWP